MNTLLCSLAQINGIHECIHVHYWLPSHLLNHVANISFTFLESRKKQWQFELYLEYFELSVTMSTFLAFLPFPVDAWVLPKLTNIKFWAYNIYMDWFSGQALMCQVVTSCSPLVVIWSCNFSFVNSISSSEPRCLKHHDPNYRGTTLPLTMTFLHSSLVTSTKHRQRSLLHEWWSF